MKLKPPAPKRLRPLLPALGGLAALSLGILAELKVQASPQLGLCLFALGGFLLVLARPSQESAAGKFGGIPGYSQRMQKWEPWFVGTLLILGGVFRLYGLTDFPMGAQGYEGEMADYIKLIENQPYTPHSVSYDILWPSTIFYQGLAFVKLLGWHAFAFRIPAALWGLISLPLFYFLVRMVAAPWVAAVASLLFNASQLHLAISRSFFPGSILWVATIAAFAFLIIAMRRGRWNYFLAAGYAAGLSLHGYVPGRMVGILFLLWFIWLYFASPKDFPEFKSILIFYCGFLMSGLPVIWWAGNHWSYYWDYIAHHNPYKGKPLHLYLAGFVRELPTYARWFHIQGDPASAEDIAGHPALDSVTGVLFPLGFFFCLFLFWKPIYAFMLALLIAAMAPALLGGGFAHPTSRRLLMVLPPVFFISAMALERFRAQLEVTAKKPIQIAFVVIAFALALWVNVRSWDWYFNKYSQDWLVKDQRDYLAHLAGQEMWNHSDFAIAITPMVDGFLSSGILFPRDITFTTVRNLKDILTLKPEKKIILLTEPWVEALLPQLKLLYPSLKYRIYTFPSAAAPTIESTFMLAIEIPREEMLALHGLRLKDTDQKRVDDRSSTKAKDRF